MGRIVAAIPAYNEEVTIGSAVLKSKKYADKVIVIDDGSSDATAEIAAAAGATVLRHSTNLGKGAAIRTALEYARNDGVDILVLHDGDMQHDPDEIPLLVRPILEGTADIVIGSRTKDSGMPLYRRIGKSILDYSTAVAMRRGASIDSQNGFRALSRAALLCIDLKSNGIGIESEMLVQAQENHLRLVQVPVSIRYDVDGSTYGPVRHGMKVMGTIISLLSQKRPLFFFGLFGLALMVAAAFLAIRTVQVYYSTRVFAIGYAFLFLLLAIVGVLSVFTGIVLNSVKTILRNTRGELDQRLITKGSS